MTNHCIQRLSDNAFVVTKYRYTLLVAHFRHSEENDEKTIKIWRRSEGEQRLVKNIFRLIMIHAQKDFFAPPRL